MVSSRLGKLATKAYVVDFYEVSDRSRRSIGPKFHNTPNSGVVPIKIWEDDLLNSNQDNDLNGSAMYDIDSVSMKLNPTLKSEVTNWKYVMISF